MWEGVPQCGRVCPSVGGYVPVWEGVFQCGRVCPCMCVCKVWVSLSHVLMMDTQVHLSMCSYNCRTHRTLGYVAKTSCCY